MLDEVNSLVAAVLAGDRDTATRLRAYKTEARERRPGLMAWASSGRKLDAIALLAELGFDLNARGRLGIQLEQPWFTLLHEAAQTGDVEMARLLLGPGADPNIRSEWGAAPLDSARQHGREAVADLLERAQVGAEPQQEWTARLDLSASAPQQVLAGRPAADDHAAAAPSISFLPAGGSKATAGGRFAVSVIR